MGQAQRQGQQHWAKNRDYRDLWRDEGTATARGAQRCYCAAGSPSSFMSSRRGVPSRTLDDRSPTTFLHGGRRVPFTDKTLTCADCGTPFTFSADDQAYHQERGFTNEPRRCQSCRAAKRVERGGGSSYSGSGGSSYGSGSYGGQREMFSATCSQCGKEAQVPFQPRGDKPVYCSDCFRSQRSSGNDYGGSSRSGSRGGYDRRY